MTVVKRNKRAKPDPELLKLAGDLFSDRHQFGISYED